MQIEQLKNVSAPKIFVSIAIVAIVFMATYNWIVTPQTTYLHAAQQYETMLGSAEQKTARIKIRIKTKKAELAELYQKIAQTRDRFFTSKTSREFFSDLEPLSLQCNCAIESLTFTPPEPVTLEGNEKALSGIIVKQAKMSLSGQYENIISFLKKLDGYSQKISISDLMIESTGAYNVELLCGMTITIHVIEDKEFVSDD